MNANEDDFDTNFEPLFQLKDKDDGEFQFEELDHKEIEMQREDILKKSHNFPFKVACDPNLPEAQTYVGRQQALDLIFEKLNAALKSFYNNRYHKNKNQQLFLEKDKISEKSEEDAFYLEKLHVWES